MKILKTLKSLFFKEGIYNHEITDKLSDEEFDNLVRTLKKLKPRKYECVVIDFVYPEFKNGFEFIQTAKNGRCFRIEIGANLPDNSYHIFVKRSETLSRTIEIFKFICKDNIFPNLLEWEDLTDEILKISNNSV